MSEQEAKKVFTNPFYAIQLAPWLTEKHELMVSKAEWIKVNTQLVQELGAEAWLTQLLDTLESNNSGEIK